MKVSIVKTDQDRYSLKCNLSGVVSTFSAVMTEDHVDIFDDVRIFIQMYSFF